MGDVLWEGLRDAEGQPLALTETSGDREAAPLPLSPPLPEPLPLKRGEEVLARVVLAQGVARGLAEGLPLAVAVAARTEGEAEAQ